MSELLSKKIQTGSHYRPAHLMSFYKGKTILPVTEKAGNEVLTLPMHPDLRDSDVDKIVKTVNSIV